MRFGVLSDHNMHNIGMHNMQSIHAPGSFTLLASFPLKRTTKQAFFP